MKTDDDVRVECGRRARVENLVDATHGARQTRPETSAWTCSSRIAIHWKTKMSLTMAVKAEDPMPRTSSPGVMSR